MTGNELREEMERLNPFPDKWTIGTVAEIPIPDSWKDPNYKPGPPTQLYVTKIDLENKTVTLEGKVNPR